MSEDSVSGKISEERFVRMTAIYETEQGTLLGETKVLTDELSKEERTAVSTKDFMQTVRKYTRTKKLSADMLHELVDRIEVYHAETVDGKKVQRLVIHYHCVGDITIPEVKGLQFPEVELKTRKGVAVSYSA